MPCLTMPSGVTPCCHASVAAQHSLLHQPHPSQAGVLGSSPRKASEAAGLHVIRSEHTRERSNMSRNRDRLDGGWLSSAILSKNSTARCPAFPYAHAIIAMSGGLSSRHRRAPCSAISARSCEHAISILEADEARRAKCIGVKFSSCLLARVASASMSSFPRGILKVALHLKATAT